VDEMTFSTIFGPTIKILEIALDLRAKRHQQIATNIANLDTPGYKPQPLAFEEQLKRIPELLETNSLSVTQERHFPINGSNISYTNAGMASASPGIGYSDTVSLEEEMTKMAENNLMYNGLAQILRGAFDKLRFVIREGR
jgi:flagellar basal-body rod protein FlgB